MGGVGGLVGLALAGGCDDVHGTLGVANHLAGQGGVKELCDLTVGRRADDDHGGAVGSGEVRNSAAGPAVPADDWKQVAGGGDAGRVEPVDVVGDQVASIVERFQVERQLVDDVRFQDVENFDRPI